MSEENIENGTPQEQADEARATPESAAPAEFNDLGGEPAIGGKRGADLDLVRDIPVTLSVEVGRRALSISSLLQLSPGSVIELDRVAGDPLDVLINGCLIAHGEVVVVNDKFGIRLTEVVSPSERMRRLN